MFLLIKDRPSDYLGKPEWQLKSYDELDFMTDDIVEGCGP